jgi:hypothetical protein
MSFMQPQACHMAMLHVETTDGTDYVPSDLVSATPTASELRDFCEGEPIVHDSGDVDCERRVGWYARFSAPGYMDRTDWIGPEESEAAALDSLAESHQVCRRCFEPCWDGPDGECAEQSAE